MQMSFSVENNMVAQPASQNVPLDSKQNVPVALLRHLRRRYILSKEIEDLACEKFNKFKKGITFADLTKLGLRKRQAQRKLKDCCENGRIRSKNKVLFAPEKHKPQQYYPKCFKAEINEYLASKRNVLVQPTGVTTCSGHPLSNTLRDQRAQNLLQVLLLIPEAPLQFHKIQLQTVIDPEYYEPLPQDLNVKWQKNRGRPHHERMARGDITFIVYPNGRVIVMVACSNKPFKLETDEDESNLFSILGQVRDRLLFYLHDPRERVVPPIMEWRLIECDINRDVEVGDLMQLTAIDIQLKDADRVFRLYIKTLGDKAVYRAEESITVNAPIYEALRSIRNPCEKEVDELRGMMRNLQTVLSRVLENHEKLLCGNPF